LILSLVINSSLKREDLTFLPLQIDD